jgi:hypothetical protein
MESKTNKMLLAFVLGLICCSGQETEILETHKSPSGEYLLNVELCNRNNAADKYILMFRLTDEMSELDYVRTGASDVQKWAVTWYNEKIVVLNSSDIGTNAWTVGREGKMISVWPVTKDMESKGDEAYKKKYGR